LQIIIRDPNMCDDFSNMTITIEEAKIIYQGKEWYVLVDLSNTHIPIPKMFSIKCRPFLVTHGIKFISFFTLDQFKLNLGYVFFNFWKENPVHQIWPPQMQHKFSFQVVKIRGRRHFSNEIYGQLKFQGRLACKWINRRRGIVIINKSSDKFFTVVFFSQSKCTVFSLLMDQNVPLFEGDITSIKY